MGLLFVLCDMILSLLMSSKIVSLKVKHIAIMCAGLLLLFSLFSYFINHNN